MISYPAAIIRKEQLDLAQRPRVKPSRGLARLADCCKRMEEMKRDTRKRGPEGAAT
jgi:hypothetical protein